MVRVIQTDGDMHVSGTLSAKNMTIPADAVDNANIIAAANIEATKLIHQNAFHYEQSTDADIAAGAKLLHTFRSAASILAMDVVPIEAPTTGDRSFYVDLQKFATGTTYISLLSTGVTVDQSSTNNTPQAATIATTTAVDGDSLRVVVTVTTGSTGNQGKGVLVTVWSREEA